MINPPYINGMKVIKMEITNGKIPLIIRQILDISLLKI